MEIIKQNIGEDILKLHYEGKSANEISNIYDLNPQNVINFINKIDSIAKSSVTIDGKLAEVNLTQTINLHEKMIEKIEDMENLLRQLKDGDSGLVDNTKVKEYIVAWKSIMDTLQWWTDRKIKLHETMENQILRNAILEAIEDEAPEVSMKIKKIIEEKRKEHGLI